MHRRRSRPEGHADRRLHLGIASGKFRGPDLAAIFSSRGTAYRAKDDLDQALSDYNKAIELDPKFSFAYTSRGLLYWDKGDFERALADTSTAIELDPKDSRAYSGRGLVHLDGATLTRL